MSDTLFRQLRAATAYDRGNNAFGSGGAGLTVPYAEFADQVQGTAAAVGELPRAMVYAGFNTLPYSYFTTGATNLKSLISTAAGAALPIGGDLSLTLGAVGATPQNTIGIFGLSFLGPPKIDRPNCIQDFFGVLGNAGTAANDTPPTALEAGAIFNSSQGANNVMGISRLGLSLIHI